MLPEHKEEIITIVKSRFPSTKLYQANYYSDFDYMSIIPIH